MKKTILLILFFNTLLSFSQHYKFNILTKYKSMNGFYKGKSIYSNKENNYYFLNIDKINNKISAEILDLKRSRKHRFRVIENISSLNEKSYQFVFLKSIKFKIHEPLKGYRHKFSIISKDSISKVVKMSLVNKKGKVINNAELKIKNYPFNLFPVFRYICLHPFEFSQNTYFNGTGIVESYTQYNKKNKENVHIYLDFFEEVNMSITVPL